MPKRLKADRTPKRHTAELEAVTEKVQTSARQLEKSIHEIERTEAKLKQSTHDLEDEIHRTEETLSRRRRKSPSK